MKFPASYSIETARCRLRHVSKDDIPHIFSATRYPGFNDGMLWDPPATEEELIAPHEANVKAWAEDRGYTFSIEKMDSKEFIGRIAIRRQKGTVWNFGFWTHPEKQNQGFMTEAATALMAFGFEELGASQITACHALWNKPSETVLKKLRMRFLETIAEGYQKNGEWVVENLLGITREEWELNKKATPPSS